MIPLVLIVLSNDVPLSPSSHCWEHSGQEGSKFASSVGYWKVTSMHTDEWLCICYIDVMFIRTIYKSDIKLVPFFFYSVCSDRSWQFVVNAANSFSFTNTDETVYASAAIKIQKYLSRYVLALRRHERFDTRHLTLNLIETLFSLRAGKCSEILVRIRARRAREMSRKLHFYWHFILSWICYRFHLHHSIKPSHLSCV